MRYLTKTSGPGASYALGSWLDSVFGGPADPSNEAGLFTGTSNIFGNIAGSIGSGAASVTQGVNTWLNTPAPAQPAAPSFWSKLGNTLLGAARNVSGNLAAQQQQQVAIAQGAQASSYMPYLLLGGAVVAAVVIYKKRKK